MSRSTRLNNRVGQVDLDAASGGIKAYVENVSSVPTVFATGFAPVYGLLLFVERTTRDMWIEWACSVGVTVSGQGAVYSQAYEVTGGILTPVGQALTNTLVATPVTDQLGTHRTAFRIGPSAVDRWFTLYGTCVREGGALSGKIRNGEGSPILAKTYLAAVPR